VPAPPILVGGQGPKLIRLVAEKADAWHWDGPIEMYRPPYERLVRSCEETGRDLAEIKLTAGVEVYLPTDRADFPEPQSSGYLDFDTTLFGPTPEDAIAMLTPLVELGVAEFTVYFWDLRSLVRFVDEVVPAFS
jgi:alkanesulfonate monooxygenase SsuD/methylene tetrahydromethanopterin reductase-like flavin-dependent oxidoreductase (luciferase family)